MAERFKEEEVVEVEAKVADEVVPSNVEVLSTGIRVQFIKMLPSYIGQGIVINSFNDLNVDKNGRVRDDLSSGDQLKVAKKLYDFNAALLLHGLNEDCIKIYDSLPENKRWLNVMKMNPLITSAHPFVNFDDELHQNFLFLFYIAFVNEDDWGLLSKHLLGRT